MGENLNGNLILVHNSISPSKLKKMFPGTKWLYFGREYLPRKKWEEILGKELKVGYKKILTEVSYSLRDEYIEFSAELGRQHWDKWQWWITSLAARNSITSPFYLYLAYLDVLKRIVEKNSGSLLIISESWELLDVIDGHWKTKTIYVKSNLKRTCYFINCKIQFVLAWAGFFKKSLVEWIIARLTLKEKLSSKKYAYDKNHIVIHTCINDACMGSDGKFKDRYYPKLADYLTEKGRNVSMLTWFYNTHKTGIVKTFKWFRKNGKRFLLPQDYYNFFDTLRSFFIIQKSAGFTFPKGKTFFRGVDILPLIKVEQSAQAKDTGAAYFVNQIKMFENWKKLGYVLGTYVDTWELKNCETEAIVGIRKYFPKCRIIAYQHAALIPKQLLFNYKTTPDEFNSSPHADIGLANSVLNRDFLVREGFPKDFIKVAPALRFMWLKRHKESKRESIGREGVLVCLSLAESIALEMMEGVYSAFGREKGLDVYIRLHPMMDFSLIKNKLSFQLPEHFKIAEGSMAHWIDRVKVVIVNQSSAMTDSAYLGIPTVVLALETDIDVIPFDMISDSDWGEGRKIWKVVYNPKELAESVQYFSSLKEMPAPKIAEQFFEFGMNKLDEIFENVVVPNK